MTDLILSAQDGWEQVSSEAMQRLLDHYGGEENIKHALSAEGVGIVSIVIDENKFPEPYTAIEGVFINNSLWLKSVLTSTL